MHDLLIGLAFLCLLIGPAIIATKSGAESGKELDD
jgi:hypothetical protein